jgi:biopolymer transport protein ExbB
MIRHIADANSGHSPSSYLSGFFACAVVFAGAVSSRGGQQVGHSNRSTAITNPFVFAQAAVHQCLWNRCSRAKVPRHFTGSNSHVLSIIEAAGWPIWLIIVTSVVALAIIGERFWSLRTSLVAPREVLPTTIREYQAKGVTQDLINRLQRGPLIGRIFAAALMNERSPREVIKDSVQDAGRAVGLELERFLNTLGTIATISTLLGLFGTIVGMIEIFGSASPSAGANPAQLAHGISVALYNTLFGIGVAIPAVIFYRHFRNKVDTMIVDMESQAIKLIEIIHGERRA